MAQQSFKLEDLIDLAEELRLSGFDLGTQQYVAAQDMMIALAAHNRLPADPREWRTLLAPVFCSSPGEQEEFYQRFDLWLKRHPELKPGKDDLAEPGGGKITAKVLPGRLRRLRKPLGIAAICLLVVLAMGAGYLSLNSDYTLTGQILSSEGNKPILKAQVEFFDKNAETDGEGKFSIPYQARNLRRIFNRQALLKVTHAEHEPHSHSISVHNPSAQPVTLQRLAIQTEQDSGSITLPAPEVTPPPVQMIPEDLPKSDEFKWYRWLLVMSPLLLFTAWWLWRWYRRRALLQKLQAAGNPQLNRIRVNGAADLLFQSQAFRRAVQELRRHRQVAVKDLDIPSTVGATINNGGMFTPRYGSRRTSPEYLLLIDRATFGDEQARFGEEVSRRLEAGGVFIDRYYFQNDPRTCRQREPQSPTLTLHELAARHPDHQLLIFSDGAGFISPLTGEPEHWLAMLGHWPRRVLLTPELAALDDYRELALAENDFVILPATEGSLAVLAEALSADVVTRPNGNSQTRPFPRLILERPKRWLERHEPRPTAVNELLEQLKRYLDDKAWQWLAACAVYPSLSWDVTLYLGYKLFGRTSDFEQRLLSLVRLPWFRYGTMPDWLRLRLIESFTPKQERAVRRALEELLLSALDRPREGVELEFAAPTPAEKSLSWKQRLQTLKSKWADWRRGMWLADLVKNEPPESPPRDYVFLGFLSSGAANRLKINLPEILRRALFPQGKVVLGLRPAVALSCSLLLSILIGVSVFNPFAGNGHGASLTQNTPSPTPTPADVKLYAQMSEDEKYDFLGSRASHIANMMRDRSAVFDKEVLGYIKMYVDRYTKRVGNGSTALWGEDLRFLFARATKNAPFIIAAFRRQDVPVVVGLYIPMIETEYRECLESPVGARGMFQIMPDTARAYGVDPTDRCNTEKMASVVALYMKDRIREFGTDAMSVALSIASYNRSPKSVRRDWVDVIDSKNNERAFWTLLARKEELDHYFQQENVKYVPKFFAAAIVGETPLTFGLDMKPLSSYSEILPVSSPTVASSPQTGTRQTPRVAPIPTKTAQQGNLGGCRGDITDKDRYVIRTARVITATGSRIDIGEDYVGAIYSQQKLDEIRKYVAGGARVRYDTRGKTFTDCVSVVTPSTCMNDLGVPRCVDVTLSELTLARMQVPNVIGKSLAEAAQAIETSRLKVGSVRRVYSSAAANTVITQQPAAGYSVNEGSTINLAIADPVGPTQAPPSAVDKNIANLLNILKDRSSFNRSNRK
jgi:hypothetical protein